MLFQVEGTGLVGAPECNRCIKHLTSEVKNLSIIDGKDDFSQANYFGNSVGLCGGKSS